MGASTSYSTVTLYSTWTTSWQTLSYRTTTVFFRTSFYTTEQLTQYRYEGYLDFDFTYTYWYDVNSGEIRKIEINGVLKNTMSTPVEKGTLTIGLSKLGTSVPEEEHAIPFSRIEPGETIDIRQGLNLQKGYTERNIRVFLVRIQFISLRLLTEVPILTRTETMTNFYVRTVTDQYTAIQTYKIEEPLYAGATLLMVATGGIAVVSIIAIIAWMRRPKAKPRTTMLFPNL